MNLLGIFGAVKGLWDSYEANKRARAAERAAMTQAEKANADLDSRRKEEDEWKAGMRKWMQQMDQTGYWDAGQMAQGVRTEVEKNRGNALENTAAALKTLGVRPGDSAIPEQIARTNHQLDSDFFQQVSALRQQLPMVRLQVEEMLNPKNYRSNLSGDYANTAGLFAGLSQQAQQQAGNPVDLLNTVLDFFPGLASGGNVGAGVQAGVSSGSAQGRGAALGQRFKLRNSGVWPGASSVG